MRQIKYVFYSLIAISILGMDACSKIDDYKKYTRDKEIYYPQKIDSVKILSGKKRIILTGLLSDPNISKIKVYWNINKDSAVFDMKAGTGTDSLRKEIDVPEGLYNFKIFTYDKLGNKSVPVNATGISYDTIYQNSLTARKLKQAGLDGPDAILEWYDAVTALGGVEVIYTDVSGTERTLIVPNDSGKTVLKDYPPRSEFKYRTWALPDSTCIDTFYTSIQIDSAVNRYEIELDKSKFSIFPLQGDLDVSDASNMWDGTADDYYQSGHSPGGGPKWFTIDLGVTARLTRFNIKTYHDTRSYFADATMREYEIWGSNDPNPNGDWDSTWAKLVSYESVKPSGLPKGELSDDDIAAGDEGDNGTFPLNTPPVRYIRIKCLLNWLGPDNTDILIGDMTFWGSPQ